MAALDPGQAARRLPGIEGVWVFVAADLTVFGLFFVSFVRDRGRDAALFEQARQTLDAVLAETSELCELWEGDPKWRASIESVRQRLETPTVAPSK